MIATDNPSKEYKIFSVFEILDTIVPPKYYKTSIIEIMRICKTKFVAKSKIIYYNVLANCENAINYTEVYRSGHYMYARVPTPTSTH